MSSYSKRAATVLLCAACGAITPSFAADPGNSSIRGLNCSEILAEDGLTPADRLELIVDLAYHSIQSRQAGLRLSGAQNAVLGLVIEETCRQSPQAELGATVDMAVGIALDARPGAADRLAAR